jgi:hypothetical protein
MTHMQTHNWIYVLGEPTFNLSTEFCVSSHVSQMRRSHPGFDQELRSLGLYQQLRDERAADVAAKCVIDEGSTLGSLTASRVSGEKKELQLGSRVASII